MRLDHLLSKEFIVFCVGVMPGRWPVCVDCFVFVGGWLAGARGVRAASQLSRVSVWWWVVCG